MQLSNAFSPIDVTLLGIVRVPVRPEQRSNAQSPIVVTLLGMVRFPIRPEQPWNAPNPIVVTLLGMVSPVRPEHCWKAAVSIVVSAPSVLNVIDVIFVFAKKALAEIAVVPGRITMAPDALGLAITVVPE